MIVNITTEQIVELVLKNGIYLPELMIFSWRITDKDTDELTGEKPYLVMSIVSFMTLMMRGEITYKSQLNPSEKVTIRWKDKVCQLSGVEIDLISELRKLKKNLENPHYVLIDLDLIYEKIDKIIGARYTDELLPPPVPKGVSSKKTLEKAKKISEQLERDLLEGDACK